MAKDDLLQKADALMRRHRVFVAGATAQDEAAAVHEDVPVLTEIVDPDVAGVPVANGVEIGALRHALAHEIENWLDVELPQHVMRVVDGITDQLVSQLSLQIRSELLPKLENLVVASQMPPQVEPADD